MYSFRVQTNSPIDKGLYRINPKYQSSPQRRILYVSGVDNYVGNVGYLWVYYLSKNVFTLIKKYFCFEYLH